MDHSSRDGNTRTPYLPPVKPYAGQEAIVRTGHGTTDWFQIGKGVRQGCILSPCLFNLYTECIKQNARLDEAQDCREKYQQPQICRWHHPYGRKWRRTKEPLDESERGEWKSWLKKFNIQKMKIMISGPITSWQIDGETMETVRDFIFFCSKITADGDCSHEIKRRLLLGRKAMTNLDNVLKSRDITLPTKVCLVKALVFPVVMYGCESWTIKKLNSEELMLLNCGVGEDSWESFGEQGDQTSHS